MSAGVWSSIFFISAIVFIPVPSTAQWRARVCTLDRISDNVCTVDASGVEHIDLCWKTDNGDPTFIRKKTCTFPKTKCHQRDEVGEKSKAWCIDATPRPPFPSIGTIRWNGTKMFHVDSYRNDPKDKRIAVEYGHATKDKAGNYFRTNTFVYRWAPKSKGPNGPHTMRTYFEYITPTSNGKYNRYYGYDNPNFCRKQVRSDTKSLSREVWDLWYNSIYELKERRNISVNTENQRWEEKLEFEEDDSFISWNITYFRKEGYALPNTKFQERNDADWRKFIDRSTFSYEEPVEKMDIKLPRHCK